MTSEFHVHNAAGYEQLMGRWSRKLALPFLDFLNVPCCEYVKSWRTTIVEERGRENRMNEN